MTSEATQNSSANSGQDAQMAEDYTPIPLSRKIVMAVISLVILVVFWMLMVAILRLNEEPEDRTRNFTSLAVMVETAKLGDVELSVDVQGEAQPRVEIDLVPQVGGKVVYVSDNFITGGIFKKGQMMIRIEDADFKANVVRAQSAVAQAEQVLIREIAESDLARRDFEDLGTGTPSALALREPQKQQAEAALSAAKAELDTANLQLIRTQVRAPFDGRVRSKDADIGQFVNPGARLGRIFSTDITEVRLALSDNDLSKLDLPIAYVAGDRASAPDVKLSATVAGKRRFWNGKIMRTESTYDTQTRALYAIAEVFDPYGEGASEGGIPLAPGLYVDANITGKTFENVITFRRDGLRPGNEVFLVDEKGKGEIRTVSVLDTDAERAVIDGGITEGEYVVLSPMEKSRISTPLRAIDFYDPTNVLVVPEERASGDDAEEAPKGFWAKLFPKEEVNPDALDKTQQQDLISALSADYAAVMRNATEAEKDLYRKMSNQEKAAFIKRKLAALPTPSGPMGGPSTSQ